jgi:hypothetical protein
MNLIIKKNKVMDQRTEQYYINKYHYIQTGITGLIQGTLCIKM